MGVAFWLTIGAILWALLAWAVGPTERKRLESEPDPY